MKTAVTVFGVVALIASQSVCAQTQNQPQQPSMEDRLDQATYDLGVCTAQRAQLNAQFRAIQARLAEAEKKLSPKDKANIEKGEEK